jgi:hypothetical protein
MLLVLCPTRGRPDKAKEAFDSFISTKSMGTSAMLFIVDYDDPAREEYRAALPVASYEHEGGGMGPPLNAAALDLMASTDILGFVGDDHRFRTVGWDRRVREELRHGGLAYGNDLGRPELPTQVFISSAIVEALGWMCLPGARHLYLDDTWRELGARSGCLHYMEDVIIEHMHPVYGKAESDAGYQRVNHPSVYSHDGTLFSQWIESGKADRDAAIVRGIYA